MCIHAFMAYKRHLCFVQLRVCHVEDPSDLCNCNISGHQLEEVNINDLKLFDNVIRVNATENKLPFESMASFPALIELEMPLNDIYNVTITQGQFETLEVVDLSYNRVSATAILMLGILPCLKQLNLSANEIESLPVAMSQPSYSWSDNKQILRYQHLEKLVLSDNLLSDVTTFAILAGLKSLQTLNLDGNMIFAIPELKLLGHTSARRSVNTKGIIQPANSRRSVSTTATTPNSRNTQVESKLLSHNNDQADNLESAVTRQFEHDSMQFFEQRLESGELDDDDELIGLTMQEEETEVGPTIESQHKAGTRSQDLPFPSLKTLNLANNKVSVAENLLHAASWPALEELLVHGNPFTIKGKGMPVVLQNALVSKGVKVVRMPLKAAKHPFVSTATRKFTRIKEESIPNVPKLNLELPPTSSFYALQSPGSPTQTNFPSKLLALPPIGKESCQQEFCHNDQHKAENNKQPDGHGQGFFLTQADDETGIENWKFDAHPADDGEVQAQTETQEADPSVKCPERFVGYEALLDAKPDDTVMIPEGVQSTAKALKRVLHHPLHLPDCKTIPTSDSSRHSYLHRKLHTLPTSTHVQETRVAELHSLLQEMKSNLNVTDRRLDSVMKSGEDPKLQREAKKLLLQVQAKYDEVRERSLRPALDIFQSKFSSSQGSQQDSKQSVQHQKHQKLL
ncbi:X-ray radiation resistance-associated protein 1-like isoform X2 [Corticium candelabrum]|uniref:X-ray radiation resistance-associated protein 1-like isoform X2 n=1 Tax=Corticium candelabrum TaxID=121492 RepID=UPI002E2695B6|nr:X-ray radiation resistance-associated protein 1-like isoform X2 [Corticium candelabrum]